METMAMTVLTGSEKQVSWAEQIRSKMLAEVAKELTESDSLYAGKDTEISEYLSTGLRTRAAWWIKFQADGDFWTRVRGNVLPETRSKYFCPDEEIKGI